MVKTFTLLNHEGTQKYRPLFCSLQDEMSRESREERPKSNFFFFSFPPLSITTNTCQRDHFFDTGVKF